MNEDDRRSLRLTLLKMKARAGLLTDEEARELRRTPILIRGEGGGALVVYPPRTAEEWEADAADARLPDSPPALPQE